jgi:hypothetical protein
VDLYRQIKKEKFGPNHYTMKMGRCQWGLRKHHINAQYYYAVPINDFAHEKCSRLGKSPFRDLWWFQNSNGNWDLTRTPEVWCETPWDFICR